VNVLFLTQVLPYPLAGGAKIRAYYMLRQLAQTHQVTLVSFVREDDRPEHIAHLQDFCRVVHTIPMVRSRLKNFLSLVESLLSGRSLVIIRDRLPAMQKLLQQLVGEHRFDIIHADQTAMGQYALFAQAAQAANGFRPRLVLDQHNALHLVVKRQATYEKGLRGLVWRQEARWLAAYEADLIREFDRVLTVTAEDRRALLDLLSEKEARKLQERFTVLPICVDTAERPPLSTLCQKPQIIFLGTMFWPPNVEGVLWFAREVLPRISAQVPEVSFVIVGKNPPPSIHALAGPDSSAAERVKITGFVSDPLPFLSRSCVFIVPLRAGGGMRVKILDAWMWGLPVVSTTIGAEGIVTRPGENILLADEAETFAAAVVQILCNPDMAGRLRNKGRQWIEAHYDWHNVYPRLESLYHQLLQ
jgi:glycosyltransferase involved in cell wall biosynthesis